MYQRTTNNELCNCTLLTFVPICCLDFPLLNWAGLWSQFTTTDFHSRNFDLIVQTRQSAVSKSRYKSPLCEALSQNLGTSSHCSVSCCCHTVQWPCPSLQANIFSDCYVQFNVDSECRARYIYMQAATVRHYCLMDNCYVLTKNIHEQGWAVLINIVRTTIFLKKILRYNYIPTIGVTDLQTPLSNMVRSS